MPDAATIADRLSDTQRGMLLWAYQGYALLAPGWARWRLHRKGLIQPWLFKGAWATTERGNEVAAILAGEPR